MLLESPQNFVDITSHSTRLKALEQRLSAICVPTEKSKDLPHITIEELASIVLLWSLPDAYSTTVTSIETMSKDTVLNFTDIVSRLMMAERRLKGAENESALGLFAGRNQALGCSSCRDLKLANWKKHSSSTCFRLHPELRPHCEIAGCNGRHYTNLHDRETRRQRSGGANPQNGTAGNDQSCFAQINTDVTLYSNVVKFNLKKIDRQKPALLDVGIKNLKSKVIATLKSKETAPNNSEASGLPQCLDTSPFTIASPSTGFILVKSKVTAPEKSMETAPRKSKQTAANELTLHHPNPFALLASTHSSERILWTVDTGASKHMQKSISNLKNVRSQHTNITTANGLMKSQFTGDLQFTSFDKKPEALKDILHCPDINCNLLSVRKILDDKLAETCTFTKDSFIASRSDGTIALHGARSGDSWTLALDPSSDQSCHIAMDATLKQNINDALLWHYRMGHLNMDALSQLSNGTLVDGVKFNSKKINCPSCVMGKHSQSPFPKSGATRATRPGEKIHSDVHGPFNIQSSRGYRYFVTFIDDYSRMVHVAFMRKKSDVFSHFVEFATRVRTLFGRSISVLHTDNGGEYKNKKMAAFCHSHGIKQEYTVDHTPQQGGIPERFNRTSVEMMRTMILHSGLPKNMWAEALQTAIYIRNHSPTKSFDRTPIEGWTGRRPDLAHFRIFGSECFAFVADSKRKDLDPKSIPCVFLGYSQDRKAYRLLKKGTNQVIEARSVRFHEQIPIVPVVTFDLIPPATPIESEDISIESVADTTTSSPPALISPTDDGHSSDDSALDESFATAQEHDEDLSPPPSPSLSLGSSLDDDSLLPSSTSPQLAELPTPSRFWTYAPMEASTAENLDILVPDDDEPGPRRSKRIQSQNAHALVAQILHDAPQTLKEAKSGADWFDWEKSIHEEFESIRTNNTAELVDLPRGKRALGSKLVFSLKKNEDGSIKRYKSRWVARGYTQQHGVDYFDTTSPVVKLASLKVVLSEAAIEDFEILQMDVTTAFLNPPIKEEVYMKQLPDFLDKQFPDKVWRLRKCIYGLKQSSRAWYADCSTKLKSLGFLPTVSDPCVFVKHTAAGKFYILLYVDDMLVIGKDRAECLKITDDIQKIYTSKFLGDAHTFVGITINRNRRKRTIHLSQGSHLTALLKSVDMEACKPVSSPFEMSRKLSKDGCPQNEAERIEMEGIPYREVVGGLLYASCNTRPDICAAVALVSRFVSNPGMQHWQAVKRILRYIQGTKDFGITLGGTGPLVIFGYSDADWAGCLDTRKSTTGYCFFINDGCVTWQCKKQSTVGTSTTDAEYMALAAGTKELMWLRSLLRELGIPLMGPSIHYQDNTGSIELTKSNRQHERTKHIDIRHHFVKNAANDGTMLIQYCPTEEMIADIMTKALATPLFLKLRDMLNMKSLSTFRSMEAVGVN
jgi:hypothetical protein